MEGLISSLLKGTPAEKLGIMPQVIDKDIVIELNENQIREMILSGVDERFKNNISIKLLDGKIVVKVKLF